MDLRRSCVVLAITVACGSPKPATQDAGIDAPPDAGPTITADDAKVSTLVDVPVTGTLHATDSAGAPIVYEIVDPPAHGTLVLVDAMAGTFQYTPASVGSIETFTFAATDLKLTSPPAQVTINVNTAASDALVLSGPTNRELPGITEGDACVPYFVERVGNVDFLATDTIVQVGGLAANDLLFVDPQCNVLSQDGTAKIFAGTTKNGFTVKFRGAGVDALTAAAPTFATGTLSVTVAAGSFHTIQIAGTATGGVGACLGPITASFFDLFGNPTANFGANNSFNGFTFSGSHVDFFTDDQCTHELVTDLDGTFVFTTPPAPSEQFFLRPTGAATAGVGFVEPDQCDDGFSPDVCTSIPIVIQ